MIRRFKISISNVTCLYFKIIHLSDGYLMYALLKYIRFEVSSPSKGRPNSMLYDSVRTLNSVVDLD